MSRRRNPKRDESRKIYLESRGELMPKDIAARLDVSPSMISKWKSIDKWEDILNGKRPDLPYSYDNGKGKSESNGKGKSKDERNRQNYQAPKGNQFAKGNKGNTKPNNKNAVKHGLYETISFDYLNKEEKDMVIDMMSDDYDPLRDVNEMIVELRIRQRRMMRRIQALEEGLSDVEKDTLSIYRSKKSGTEVEIDGDQIVEKPKYELKEVERHESTYRKVSDILSIEDALTRVTDSLLRAIKTRNDLEESTTFKRDGHILRNRKLEKELEVLDAGPEEEKPIEIQIVRASRKSDGEDT